MANIRLICATSLLFRHSQCDLLHDVELLFGTFRISKDAINNSTQLLCKVELPKLEIGILFAFSKLI